MKLLVNTDGYFNYIDLPDKKIYQVHELKDCAIPPLFLLYEHELFINDNSDGPVERKISGGNSTVNGPVWYYSSPHNNINNDTIKKEAGGIYTCGLAYYPQSGVFIINNLGDTTLERKRRNHSSINNDLQLT